VNYLESLLYNYTEIKKDTLDYHNKCIEQELGNMQYDSQPKAKTREFNSTVENAAVNFDEGCPDQEGIVKAVEKTLKVVDIVLFRFYQLRYEERMERMEVQNKLDISRRTFYRRRRELLKKLKENLNKEG